MGFELDVEGTRELRITGMEKGGRKTPGRNFHI
jgi:hypothetical protein